MAAPTVGVPDKVDFGIAEAGAAPIQEVPGVPGGQAEKTGLGLLFSETGERTSVMREGDSLSLSRLSEPGTYTGNFDLNGSDTGGEATLTARARDALWLPLATLLLGTALALLPELWLTFERPRGVLELRLKRLCARVKTRQDEADRELKRVQPSGDSWQAPDMVSKGALVPRETTRLQEALADAKTDTERDDFGPDGEEMKNLEAQEAVHMLVWGSAATAGVTLLRRLIPGGLKALQGVR